MLKDEFISYLEKQTDEPFFVIESVLKTALSSGEVVLRSDVDELVKDAEVIVEQRDGHFHTSQAWENLRNSLSKFKPKAGA